VEDEAATGMGKTQFDEKKSCSRPVNHPLKYSGVRSKHHIATAPETAQAKRSAQGKRTSTLAVISGCDVILAIT
jgi:hypothetical protein